MEVQILGLIVLGMCIAASCLIHKLTERWLALDFPKTEIFLVQNRAGLRLVVYSIFSFGFLVFVIYQDITWPIALNLFGWLLLYPFWYCCWKSPYLRRQKK